MDSPQAVQDADYSSDMRQSIGNSDTLISRSRLVGIALVVIATLWSPSYAKDNDDVQRVDFCTVALSPENYVGQVVKVRGIVTFSFEESTFTSTDCYDEWWLEKPNEYGHVIDKPPAGERVVLGVSFDQFHEWSKAGALADTNALPWETTETAEPVAVVRNRRWRRLSEIECPTPATLIGRIDHLRGPGFISINPRHGFVWQSSNYGHLDLYPVRFVLAEVVSLGRGKSCKGR